jgi:hypothetical protein
MAGLLDIFGTGGTETLSLLGMSPAEIQRNRDDAQAQALYGLAARLFQGGNTGQSIAEGLQQGQKLYSAAMQNQLQDQLQGFQLKDLLEKRKREKEAEERQAMIDRAVAGAYRPAVAAVEPPTPTGPLSGAAFGEVGTPAQAAGFDFQTLAPILMATPQGRKTLGELMTSQKAMQGELTKVGENERLIRINPLTNEQEVVATGASKVAKLSGKEGNAALMFYGTDDVSQLRNIPGAIDKIRIEATTQRKAEQPQINLADPTAVQTQQLKTINQWEGLLKDSGDSITASRANAFYNAFNLSSKGNANADGALIYNLAKIYDPSGAVQQGDVNTIIGNRDIPTNIQLFAQKFKAGGGTFTPKERNNMKQIIDGVIAERKKSIEPSLNTYRKINKGLGGDDSAIYNPYDLIKQPKSLEEILGLRPRGNN